MKERGRGGERGERGRGRGDDDYWVTETAGWWRDWCGPEEKKPLVALFFFENTSKQVH
jgi:hypothetical protein